VALEYSSHAMKRMKARRITPADVDWAPRHPVGNPALGETGSVWIEGHAVGGRILKVCVAVDDHEYVITAAWP
jgi:Domain of unknown function (DUF4258)